MRIARKRTWGILGLGLCAFLVPSIALAFDVDTRAPAIAEPSALSPSSSLSASDAGQTSATDSTAIAASKRRQGLKDRGATLGGKIGGKHGARVGKHLLGSKTSHRVAVGVGHHLMNHAMEKMGF